MRGKGAGANEMAVEEQDLRVKAAVNDNILGRKRNGVSRARELTLLSNEDMTPKSTTSLLDSDEISPTSIFSTTR